MTDVERAHLRAAAAAGGRHREAHLVVDIHERQRPGRVRAGAGDVRAARAHRRELVADAAARLQRQPRLVHLGEDVVHRVVDRAGDRAVDRRSRRLVLLRAGVRDDAAGGNRALAQGPQELLVPLLAHVLALHVRERARDALVRLVHRAVDRRAVFGAQPVFLVPDIEGGFLKWNAVDVHGLKLDWNSGLHAGLTLCDFDRAVPIRLLPNSAGSRGPDAAVAAHLTTHRLRFCDGCLRTGRSRFCSSRNTTYCVRGASLCPAGARRQEICKLAKTVRLFNAIINHLRDFADDFPLRFFTPGEYRRCSGLHTRSCVPCNPHSLSTSCSLSCPQVVLHLRRGAGEASAAYG